MYNTRMSFKSKNSNHKDDMYTTGMSFKSNNLDEKY